MMLHGLGRISRMSPEDGFFTGSLAQALTMTSPDARAGIDAFLKKSDIPL
jgi:(methylthio)acryloyl-CoA hydratase